MVFATHYNKTTKLQNNDVVVNLTVILMTRIYYLVKIENFENYDFPFVK